MSNFSAAAWAEITKSRVRRRVRFLRETAMRLDRSAKGNERMRDAASCLHHLADLYQHHGMQGGYPNYAIPNEGKPVHFPRAPVSSYAGSPMAMCAEAWLA